MPNQSSPPLSLPEGTDVVSLLSALAATSSELLLLVDGDGRIQWASPSWLEKTGYTVASAIGERLDAHVDERHRARLVLDGDPPPAYGGAGHFGLRHRVGRVLRMTSRGAPVQVGDQTMHLLTWTDGTALDSFAGVLAGLGRDQPLDEAMELLTRATEARFPDACAWVQLIDDAGHLRTAAGPYVPPVWLAAADGFACDDPEGPTSLPCIDDAPLFVSDLGRPGCAIGAREASMSSASLPVPASNTR